MGQLVLVSYCRSAVARVGQYMHIELVWCSNNHSHLQYSTGEESKLDTHSHTTTLCMSYIFFIYMHAIYPVCMYIFKPYFKFEDIST